MQTMPGRGTTGRRRYARLLGAQRHHGVPQRSWDLAEHQVPLGLSPCVVAPLKTQPGWGKRPRVPPALRFGVGKRKLRAGRKLLAKGRRAAFLLVLCRTRQNGEALPRISFFFTVRITTGVTLWSVPSSWWRGFGASLFRIFGGTQA